MRALRTSATCQAGIENVMSGEAAAALRARRSQADRRLGLATFHVKAHRRRLIGALHAAGGRYPKACFMICLSRYNDDPREVCGSRGCAPCSVP
jgi:hypothetical protein